ncbi:hypothetical protein [Methanothermobacter thermautotrophicus]|uniref:Uncharacterized protein n=1 Tax=Methanothermobacter thermautotrophicus (strain ATCC 29096 / DSM 1053 / JCM 10044 / NBRC 100330 / Delta H) TaxID=187420 RepID=O27563_METTH|nr:hypothetical protein [Methanothermobacter thermautotrophicus]AAB85994.1 unknown [Methanothermobacter thermautotrophicus str. Delta H]MBC7110816.1 hypothetical protein [Methanothermobacter sp.]MDI6818118.1 hypothetical protein [Methanothermobacter thermautotrophicus]WBF06020.1 hypothetical protein ISG35_07255 [Methanothermobacter thermautotrophicus]
MRWLALLMLMIFVAGSSIGTCMAHSGDTLKPAMKGKAGGGFKSSSGKHIDLDDDDDSGGADDSAGGDWLWLLVLIILIVVIAVLILIYLRR